MKELSLERMEEIQGGSVNVPACGAMAITAIGVGFLIATTPMTGGSFLAVAGYMFGGFSGGVGLGMSMYDCFSSF